MKVYRYTEVANINRDENSDLNAVEAAFLAVARDGEQGTYEFDMNEDARERGAIAPDDMRRERVRIVVEWPDWISESSEYHEFQGRHDRGCTVCGQPDRAQVHSAAREAR